VQFYQHLEASVRRQMTAIQEENRTAIRQQVQQLQATFFDSLGRRHTLHPLAYLCLQDPFWAENAQGILELTFTSRETPQERLQTLIELVQLLLGNKAATRIFQHIDLPESDELSPSTLAPMITELNRLHRENKLNAAIQLIEHFALNNEKIPEVITHFLPASRDCLFSLAQLASHPSMQTFHTLYRKWRILIPFPELLSSNREGQIAILRSMSNILTALETLKNTIGLPDDDDELLRDAFSPLLQAGTSVNAINAVRRRLLAVRREHVPLTDLTRRWLTLETDFMLITNIVGQLIDPDADFDEIADEINSHVEANESGNPTAGNEALMREKQLIISGYRDLLADPQIARLIETHIPPLEDSDQAFEITYHKLKQRLLHIIEQAEQVVETNQIPANIVFRVQTALQALEILRGTADGHAVSSREHYRSHRLADLPSIRQVSVLLYRLLPAPEPFVKNYLSHILSEPEKWVALRKKCRRPGEQCPPSIQHFLSYATIGEGWAADESAGNPALHAFALNFEESLSGDLKPLLSSDQHRNMLQAFIIHEVDALIPMIEALFMTMRGHTEGDLLDPANAHSPACAEGAYLNLLKAIAGLEAIGRADLFNVEITHCEAPIAAAASPQGEETRDNQRARDLERRAEERRAHHSPRASQDGSRERSRSPRPRRQERRSSEE
jgi:hypothetical protein